VRSWITKINTKFRKTIAEHSPFSRRGESAKKSLLSWLRLPPAFKKWNLFRPNKRMVSPEKCPRLRIEIRPTTFWVLGWPRTGKELWGLRRRGAWGGFAGFGWEGLAVGYGVG